MKSIKQQYIDLREGRMSQHNFMRSVRMSLPQYITNVTSFNDTVKILKNKGILNEATIGINPVESALKSYLAKGYSYSEAIRAVAAEENTDEDMLASQYPQDRVDIEGYEDNDENAKLKDMIAKAEDELSPEMYKNQDFPGGLSEKAHDGLKIEWDWDNADVDYDTDEEGNEGAFGTVFGRDKKGNAYSARFDAPVSGGDADFDSADVSSIKKTEDASELYEAKEIKGSSSKEQYSQFSEAENDNLEEVTTGINIEHECFPEKPYEEIEKIVLKNIKKNPNYYTNYKLTGIRDYQLQTMDTSKPESHQMKFVKGEDSYVDKARVMKPVKGFEKTKASSNKASKETNKIVKGVEELTHFAQTVRGLQKFAATGGKMKTIKLKEEIDPEIEGKPSQAYLDFLAGKKQGEKIMQATNASGVKFSVNDMVVAPDGKKIKITGFTTGKDGKMKAMYSAGMFADVYNLDDLEKKPSFRPGVNLGKYDLKSMLEKMVREVIDEMYDGRDDMNEEESLDSKEQDLVNAVLGDINEGIDLGKILAKVKLLASKGLLTAAMASVILTSCGESANDTFKRELDNAKKVQDLEQVQQAKIDSVTNSMNTGVYK